MRVTSSCEKTMNFKEGFINYYYYYNYASVFM